MSLEDLRRALTAYKRASVAKAGNQNLFSADLFSTGRVVYET